MTVLGISLIQRINGLGIVNKRCVRQAHYSAVAANSAWCGWSGAYSHARCVSWRRSLIDSQVRSVEALPLCRVLSRRGLLDPIKLALWPTLSESWLPEAPTGRTIHNKFGIKRFLSDFCTKSTGMFVKWLHHESSKCTQSSCIPFCLC